MIRPLSDRVSAAFGMLIGSGVDDSRSVSVVPIDFYGQWSAGTSQDTAKQNRSESLLERAKIVEFETNKRDEEIRGKMRRL